MFATRSPPFLRGCVEFSQNACVRRRQLVELEDLDWCPRVVRDGGTDWLAFTANATKVFSAVAPKIRSAMALAGTDQVLDLCSGGGGPWPTLVDELARTGPIEVRLSDRFPNLAAFLAFQERSRGRLGFHEQPVDATDVPRELRGVRTLFNAFHHFPPEVATAILSDAVREAVSLVEDPVDVRPSDDSVHRAVRRDDVGVAYLPA